MSDQRQRRQVILHEVLQERAAQDEQWGGADHDDDHDESDWCTFIRKQLGYAEGASLLARIEEVLFLSVIPHDFTHDVSTPSSADPLSIKQESLDEYRSRMVKIAALAVAALESFDRRNS